MEKCAALIALLRFWLVPDFEYAHACRRNFEIAPNKINNHLQFSFYLLMLLNTLLFEKTMSKKAWMTI